MKQTPLQQVKEQFGTKAALAGKVAALLEKPSDESDDDFRARLTRVSNAKLLHLHDVGERVQAHGGKDALVKKIAELKGQPKDFPYIDRLGRRSLGSLLDLHASLSRRAAGKAKRATPRRQRRRAR